MSTVLEQLRASLKTCSDVKLKIIEAREQAKDVKLNAVNPQQKVNL